MTRLERGCYPPTHSKFCVCAPPRKLRAGGGLLPGRWAAAFRARGHSPSGPCGRLHPGLAGGRSCADAVPAQKPRTRSHAREPSGARQAAATPHCPLLHSFVFQPAVSSPLFSLIRHRRPRASLLPVMSFLSRSSRPLTAALRAPSSAARALSTSAPARVSFALSEDQEAYRGMSFHRLHPARPFPLLWVSACRLVGLHARQPHGNPPPGPCASIADF